MAEHLASLFGTEKDRVNCPFYFKIGACRHGDRCSRAHNKPSISPTVLLHNLWRSPAAEAAAQAAAAAADTGLPPPPPKPPTPEEERRAQADFEDFYEDIFEELTQFGELESLHVCDNVADHLAGSVYAQFVDEDDAAKAMSALQRRFYDGRSIVAEFSPVTDFREATCRQYEERCCARGGYCNFMHLRPVSRSLRRELFGRWADDDRGRDRDRDRERERRPSRRERDRDDDDRRGRGDRRDDGREDYLRDDRDRRYGGSRDESRGDRERRSSRRSRSRSRSRSRERGRDRERGGGGGDRGGGGGRESSEERRARIAAWNAELEAKE